MTSIDLSTKIANVHLKSCIYNASGPKCSTKEELDALSNSAATAIITKSATIAHREGNEAPRYQDLSLGSINSMGLPNLGIDYYLDYIENYSFDKPIFLSIAGFSLEENINILKKTEASDKAFAIELNLSCPNIAGKPQTAYDFERTKEVLDKVFSFYQRPLGVKLPPYFDMIHFEEMAAILNQYPLGFVTCINSIGNALFIDTDEEAVVIKPKAGFGGLGGEYIKPTALANVRMFYTLLNKEIDVIGCGGVSSGKDVFEHILCGASAVQVGTQLMKEGVGVFERLENELKSIMKEKGYSTITDFKGNLKSL